MEEERTFHINGNTKRANLLSNSGQTYRREPVYVAHVGPLNTDSQVLFPAEHKYDRASRAHTLIL